MGIQSLDIYFQSGVAGESVHYQKGDNIQVLEITNSDDQYFQTGTVSLFAPNSSQSVGDTVKIKINNELEFDGYISARQQGMDAGIRVETYSLVGKTKDLWRYNTDSEAVYTGWTSSIVFSLISTYTTGIGVSDVPGSMGVYLDDEIDLTNMIVGDALVKLAKIDGYKFYVNDDDVIQYYNPPESSISFTVKDSDYLELSPIEESDEYLVNDVIVIGGTDYSSKTQITTHPSSNSSPSSNVYIAQRFNAEESRLSATSLYLGRTTDPNKPNALQLEVWSGNSADTNNPLSGTKQEWSDDATITAGIIPYAPSWSSWVTYTDPKLRLTRDKYYWLVLKGPTKYLDTIVFGPDTFESDWDDWIIPDGSSVNRNAGGGCGGSTYAVDMDWSNSKGRIWKSQDMSDCIHANLSFCNAGGTYGATTRTIAIYASSNGNGWDQLITWDSAPASDKRFSVDIPNKYLRSNSMFLISAQAGSDGATVWYLDNITVSGTKKYWTCYYDPKSITSYPSGGVSVSYDNGVTWQGTTPFVPTGNLTFKLGWTQGAITARASNQTSIDTYGRHFRRIEDSTINTLELAQARADAEVSGTHIIPLNGTITIDGRTDLSVDNKFTLSSQYLGLSENLDIVSYTQRIDENGFNSIIEYGKHLFDISKKITILEKEVLG